MKNKQVKQMMASVFNGEWAEFPNNKVKLVVFSGSFGPYGVSYTVRGKVSLTADQLKNKG